MTTSIGETHTKPPKEGDLWYKPLTNQLHIFIGGKWNLISQKHHVTLHRGLLDQTIPAENGVYQLVPDPLTSSASFQRLTPVKDEESGDWD